MSADEDLGYVYLPFSTSSNVYYGGHRHGDNLFGETLVCLDARTGRRIWHYQIVRHGLWDYDLPAAPNLIDVTVSGQRVKAVAQVTKQGFVFVFDRVTGAPLWPIEDRPVPPSRVSGEKAATTQPFPTKPAAFEIQGVREEDLIDFTPGAAPRSPRDRSPVRSRAPLHAAERDRYPPDAGRLGRSELVGGRLGPRDRDVLCHDDSPAHRDQARAVS